MNQLALRFKREEIDPWPYAWGDIELHELTKRWHRAERIPATRWTHQNGHHTVTSESGRAAGYTHYTVTDTECNCPDAVQRAPWAWCKHRLALWMHLHSEQEAVA